MTDKNRSNNWGGYRNGAGSKGKWNYGDTKVVRIPIALEKTVLEYARKLDSLKENDSVTESSLDEYDTVTNSSSTVTESIKQLEAIKEILRKWEPKVNNGNTSPRLAKAKELYRELIESINSSDSLDIDT